MKKALTIALAILTGVSVTAALKRAELQDRLDAMAGADVERSIPSSRLAQWLNYNPFNNFNNWGNY